MRRIVFVLAIVMAFCASLWRQSQSEMRIRTTPFASQSFMQTQNDLDRSYDDRIVFAFAPQEETGGRWGSTYEQHMQQRAKDTGQEFTDLDAASLEGAPRPYAFELSLDLANQRFYRGILRQHDGLLIQPGARLAHTLINESAVVVDIFAGTWNSIGGDAVTAPFGGADPAGDWHESDLYAGLKIQSDDVILTFSYIYLNSPSNAFESVHEFDVTLALDDRTWWGDKTNGNFALNPYVTLGIETSDDGADGPGSGDGVYCELGVEPRLALEFGTTPLLLSVPLAIGISLDDYYQNAQGEDDSFGFFRAGVKASLPLPLFGDRGNRFGQWTLHAGAAALLLGDHTSEYNGGDDTEFIGTIGLRWHF